ncbi:MULTISPECIES: hypothetical protein [Primorskyibacter]|uniref:hypothetical protein n=1 Tax=Primorskyibacter TaxID=1068904 RepID=UPI0018E51F90|nr:hypothetical protein [Primorskyibacter marinus]
MRQQSGTRKSHGNAGRHELLGSFGQPDPLKDIKTPPDMRDGSSGLELLAALQLLT